MDKSKLAEVIQSEVSKIQETVGYAYIRYQDERDFEPWSEFSDYLISAAKNAGLQPIKTQRRPFGVVIRFPDLLKTVDVLVYSNPSFVCWKTVPRTA